MANRSRDYLRDPLLERLYTVVREAGPLESIALDAGCYFFTEGMDRHESPKDEAIFNDFIAREKRRGTNFITIVGASRVSFCTGSRRSMTISGST